MLRPVRSVRRYASISPASQPPLIISYTEAISAGRGFANRSAFLAV